MFIRLLPDQIPNLWDAIKFASSRANSFNREELPAYFMKLLVKLLNERAQCFIRLSKNRRLMAVVLTEFSQDVVTGKKNLLLTTLYSYEPVSMEQWKNDLEFVQEFARNTDCHNILTYSNNKRVFEIAEAIGFTENFRCFKCEVGGN